MTNYILRLIHNEFLAFVFQDNWVMCSIAVKYSYFEGWNKIWLHVCTLIDEIILVNSTIIIHITICILSIHTVLL